MICSYFYWKKYKASTSGKFSDYIFQKIVISSYQPVPYTQTSKSELDVTPVYQWTRTQLRNRQPSLNNYLFTYYIYTNGYVNILEFPQINYQPSQNTNLFALNSK